MAKELTIQQKKDWAKLLFTRENLTQKEIAERVGVSAQSVNKWVKLENWENLKVSITITKDEQLKCLYKQLSELNKSITDRAQGTRFATSSEADTISKLANAIDKMETDIGLSDIITTFRKFLDWIRKSDLSKAQEIAPLFDAFIKDNLK